MHQFKGVVATAVVAIVKPVLDGMIKEDALILVSFTRELILTTERTRVSSSMSVRIPKLRLSCLV